MAGPICKTRKAVTNYNKSTADQITSQIGDVKASVATAGETAVKDFKETKKQVADTISKGKQQLKDLYLKQPWRDKRPDVTLLVELVFVIVLAVILYYAWPYITGSVKPSFSKDQFNKATMLPDTAFNIEEIAKVNLEVKSLQDYASYFKSAPYSMKNSGVYDLMVNVAVLPLIIFFIQFVLPPFVIAYIIWFIIRFWPYVIAAVWGWIVTMYNYFTSLIQGKLGCKWYIRMVTGWGCNSPNFYEYYVGWRRRYVDRPIYYEKLKYIRKYYWARHNYYVLPWHRYITIPYERYKVKAQFAKKVYVDRAIEVFLKKLREMYPQYYTMPRDEFYKWLLGNNKHMAAVYSKAMQAKAQIDGRPYRSITEQGRQCMCPGTKTPLRMIKKTIKQQAKEAKTDIESLIAATNEVYDKVTKMQNAITPDCETADNVIKNRKTIAGTALVAIIGAVLTLYLYSVAFGTPSWLYNIISPTARYVTHGAQLVAAGYTYWSLPVIYVVALGAVLAGVLLT